MPFTTDGCKAPHDNTLLSRAIFCISLHSKKKTNMTQYPCFTVWNRIRVGAVFYGLTLPWG